jgi:RNA polymerase sigma-70 factor (ECF subfamily)
MVVTHERHYSKLYAYARSMVHRHDTALDAVQECFVRYFVELSNGRAVQHPRAWLYRVACNYLLDHIKSAAVKRESPLLHGDRVPEPKPTPEEIFQRAQLARSLASLLSPREMECIGLRSENLSYKEIAAILKIRPGTVSALLTRAHKKLSADGKDKRSLEHLTIAALHLLFQTGGG